MQLVGVGQATLTSDAMLLGRDSACQVVPPSIVATATAALDDPTAVQFEVFAHETLSSERTPLGRACGFHFCPPSVLCEMAPKSDVPAMPTVQHKDALGHEIPFGRRGSRYFFCTFHIWVVAAPAGLEARAGALSTMPDASNTTPLTAIASERSRKFMVEFIQSPRRPSSNREQPTAKLPC
jgi:hypothetical protein